MADQRTEISALGEFGLIDYLTKNIEILNPSTVLGVGDDAAVVDHAGMQTVLSTDMLVEGIHFDLAYSPLKYLGYKAVSVNLSDIYAMNATPTQILLSIACSNRFSVEALHDFYEGVYLACEQYQVDLVGGDTAASQKGLIISVTAAGQVAPDKFVTRTGAQVNDLICVSGELGNAYLGLLLLEREKKIWIETPSVQPDFEQSKWAIEKLLKPTARQDVIEWLATQKIIPTAMIDISDGLSSEILHIAKQSKKGIRLYEDKLPFHAQADELAGKFNLNPTTVAMNGGEDYELLFTIPQKDFQKIAESKLVSVIGFVTDQEKGNKLITTAGQEVPITAQGWQNFG
ncbi:MAG: thiamine-phosphate kinase [Phycisphaerales bacterium]|nr:thiamine-phosphate kinase [Phycisphaerales bacterium]